MAASSTDPRRLRTRVCIIAVAVVAVVAFVVSALFGDHGRSSVAPPTSTTPVTTGSTDSVGSTPTSVQQGGPAPSATTDVATSIAPISSASTPNGAAATTAPKVTTKRPTTTTVAPVASVETTAPPTPDPTVRLTQVLLNETGANVPVDGINGPATQAAIVVFQQAHGLPSTGSLDTGGIDVLKHSAAGSMIAGTWTGTIFQTGTLLGTLDAVWVSNVTAQLTFSYLPCTGTATYLDFDGVHLTVHTQLAPISTPSCNQSGTSVATFTSPTSLTFDSAATFGPTSGVMTRVG